MQLALGLMCQPTQNGAFQPYQCMAMVFRYRQSEDNDACQGRDVDFTGRSNFPPNPLPTPGLCGGPAGECLGWCISPARFASMRSTNLFPPFVPLKLAPQFPGPKLSIRAFPAFDLYFGACSGTHPLPRVVPPVSLNPACLRLAFPCRAIGSR
jgi:hypothetical protein